MKPNRVVRGVVGMLHVSLDATRVRNASRHAHVKDERHEGGQDDR
jgi:hypothetical protein